MSVDLAAMIALVAAAVTRELLHWYDSRERRAGRRRTRSADRNPKSDR